jgi:GNAT superfamily N-acetyltransferase
MQVVTSELVDRIVAIEIANLESRFGAYAARPGNPAGVHIRRFGGAVAFAARNISVRLFNSTLGVGADTAEHLDAIEAFYRGHGTAGALEIVPGRLSEPLGLELGARGWSMVEFHTGLARPLSAADRAFAPPPGVTVDEISPADAGAFDRFIEIYIEGYSMQDEDGHALANMRAWRDIREWRFYLARVGGEPAGVAILDRRGSTAMLGSAATRPSLRGHGVQAALLGRRIADAAASGCDLIIGGAYFGTTSMRNQQRAGFHLAFTRGVWVQRGQRR